MTSINILQFPDIDRGDIVHWNVLHCDFVYLQLKTINNL